jgi:hypothetical protein
MTPCIVAGTPRKTDGYVTCNAPHYYAHRRAWVEEHGPIPDGLEVCHSCDNRACRNVDHLFLGTHKANMDDRDAKGRQARGARGGHARLTEVQVAEAKQLRLAGWTWADLGRRYGVHLSTAHSAVNGKNWRHLVAQRRK